MAFEERTPGYWIDKLEAKRKRVKELEGKLEQSETILSAWHSIFGTTQLSHASDRLKIAERAVEMAQGFYTDVVPYTKFAIHQLEGFCQTHDENEDHDPKKCNDCIALHDLKALRGRLPEAFK